MRKAVLRLFFELQTKEAVQEFLIKHVEKPHEIKDVSIKGLGIGFRFVYPGGITYLFRKEDSEIISDNQIVIQPVSPVSVKKSVPPKLSIIDLRQVHWGMSREQVKATHKQIAISKGDDSIYYQETFLEYPVVLNYFFKKDRLIGAAYVFSQEHPGNELNNFIDDFNKVKEALIKEYGEPNIDTHFWNDSLFTKLYKKEPERHGFAVKTGALTYVAGWEKERTSIILSLKGEESREKMRIIVLTLSFEAKKEIADKF